MSRATPGVAVVDCGHKGVSVDSGMPGVWERPGLRYAGASDEHGKIMIEDGAAPALGEKLRLVPGHCDPTVDRYDWYVGVRKGRVECLWPIAARGCDGLTARVTPLPEAHASGTSAKRERAQTGSLRQSASAWREGKPAGWPAPAV